MNTPEYYAKFAAPSSFEGSYVAPQKSFDFDAVYNYAGKNLGYITRYPELSPYGDSEQIQAEKQSGWDKALNSGLQLGALATNTFANHFYSYGRQASALTNQDWSKLWQDDFGQESAQMIQGVSDLYPIYETEEQQRLRDEEGGLLTSLKQFVPFTGRAGNAWANLAGQLGFMAGTAGAVAAESLALGALTAATEGVAAPLAAAKTVSNAKLLKSMYTVFKNARTGLTGVKNAAQSAGLIGNIVKSPVFTTYRMLTAAQGEAAIEANINALEYKNKQLEKYGVNVTPEQMQEIDTRATELGNTVFNWNAPVLMLGNAMTIGSLFRVGNLGKSATSQLIKEEATGVIKKKFGELTTKEALNPFIKKTWEFSKKGGKFVVNENLYEGVEEVLQGIGGRAAQHMYETYDSEGGKGLDAFLTALGEETSNTFSTREGWDEFVSGALTGYGIKGITSVYNRATGATAKEQAIRDFTQKGVEQDIQSVNNYMKSVLTNTDPNTNYVKNQVASIEQQETAIADGNVKVAKDAQGQTKIGLFSKLQKYGTSVSDDIFDLWGETMKEMQKTNETDFRQMMGDRNVEEVVSKLKQENKQFNDVYNTIDKNAKNPYNQKTDSKNYQLYEQAKLFAAGMEYNARDSKERGQAIVKDLTTNFGIDETLIASMFDGTTLRDNLTTAKKLFKLQEEALKNAATPEEREALEQELLKSKEKVELLQAIETGAFDEKGNPVYGEKNPEETAAMFIKAYYRDKSALVPDELKKNIEDLITLETESEGYLAAYNFLSNKDYLEKFAESYLNEANKKIAQSEKNISRNQKAASKPIITPEEKYDDNQVDEALTGTTAKASITDFLEEVRSKKQSDGTYLHNGKKYNTAKELAEDLKKETEGFENLLDQTNDKGESIDSILEKALNNLEEELTEQGDAVRKTEGQPKQVIQPKTKTQSEAEIKKGFWQKSSPYNTKVHSFDLVISFLFPKDLSYLFDSLVKANQNDVLNVIQNGLSRIGRGARVTMINLADETVIDVSRIKNPEQIEVISDGIRFYIITPADVAPNVVIKEQLGLEVGDAERKFTTIRNDKGTVISSPFRAANQITPASDDVIHSLKIDDEVEIFVADNQYNRDLQDKRNNNEITEQEYTDKLVLSVVKNGEIIGVLRAADFLFEQEENQAQMDEFRSQFANRELGDRIGSTPVQGFEVARGYNYVNGQIQYTTLNEYNPVNYSTSFYFVKEDGTIIDEQGNEVQEDFFDRGSFAQGGVYMRVDGVNNKKNHTVQVLRSDNDNSVFTEEEFTSGKFKEIGQTSLSDEPIISKRISISLRQVKDTDTTHSEGIKEQVQNITDNKVLSQEEEKEVAKLEKDLAKKQESLDKVNRQIDENKERVKKYNESGVLGQAEYKKLTKKDIDLNISKQSLEKDIQDINQKIKLIKGDRAVIEDVNGAQTVVDSVVESENETVLISVNGETIEVKLSEISSVEPVETETTPAIQEQPTTLPADNVQTAPTEQDANKWIAQNAKTGDKLILTDGTEIEIVSNEDGVITIKRTKNDTTVQQVFRVLPDGTVVSDEPLSLEKAEEPLALPRRPQDTTVIDSFRERLRKHGIESEVVLSALSQVYQKSINEGNPITNLDDLIEASGLTATQKEQLQMVLTPVYRMGVWQFLTNSDTIFDIAQQERWAAFQTTIKSILEESGTVESSLPTDNLKNEFKLNVIDALSDVFNNFKIGIKNIEIANTFTLPDWNKITSALSAAVNTINPREAIVKLQQDLADLGLQVYAKGLIQVARVSRASLGRNPQVATDYNNVYTDLSMANVDGKIFVRNEKDGLFVEVKATKKKFSENVINIQKDLLSLLGVKFPLEYLNAYQRINGDFAALKERAIYEQQRADALPNFSFSEIKPESISFVTEDLFVSKYSASTLSLDGKKYYNLLTLENGETVYAPINKRLNSAEVRNLLKRNGLNVGKIVRKDQSFAERLSKIAKIKKQLEKITCN